MQEWVELCSAPLRYLKASCVALALFVLCLALVGCSTVAGDFCDGARVHRFSDATVDAMTEAEAEQELAHNLLGQKLCGWKAAD